MSLLFREEIYCPSVHPITLGLFARIVLAMNSRANSDDLSGNSLTGDAAAWETVTRDSQTAYMVRLEPDC